MNLLDKIDNIIPFIEKNLRTHFDNPMPLLFYKLNQNNLLYGENTQDEKYLCAILEGD